MNASWYPHEKNPAKIIMYEGSLTANLKISPRLSSNSSFGARSGALINGNRLSTRIIEIAKIMKTDCQFMLCKRKTATVGPTIWPAEPDAVAMARLMDLFSGLLALPTTARITPNPVPAIPNPIRTSYSCIASGEVAVVVNTKPAA